MTSNVKLLPLPDKVEVDKHLPTGVCTYAYDADTLRTYARANVEHHTAAQAAEIEALRAKTAMTMGVGTGDGKLFVHGDYESIKAAQEIVLERDALRAEMDEWKAVAKWESEQHDSVFKEARALNERAERLAEALRMIESAKDRGFGIDYARGVAQSALRDHEQEVGNWTCEMRPNVGIEPPTEGRSA